MERKSLRILLGVPVDAGIGRAVHERADEGVRSYMSGSGFHARQRHRYMFVDCLTLVVVFRMRLAIGTGDGLSGLVSLETQLPDLMTMGLVLITEALVAKHQVVMGLEIFGIDGQY